MKAKNNDKVIARVGLFTQCPFCLQYFSHDALPRHIYLSHPKERDGAVDGSSGYPHKRHRDRAPTAPPATNVKFPKDDTELQRIKAMLQADKYVICKECDTLVLRSKIAHHKRHNHPAVVRHPREASGPLGLQVLKDLGTHKWKATLNESCDSCR